MFEKTEMDIDFLQFLMNWYKSQYRGIFGLYRKSKFSFGWN